MIRFCLHPDRVMSVNDDDQHFISAPELARLHGVRMSECIVIDPHRPHSSMGLDTSKLLHLGVSTEGAGYWPVSKIERQQYPKP